MSLGTLWSWALANPRPSCFEEESGSCVPLNSPSIWLSKQSAHATSAGLTKAHETSVQSRASEDWKVLCSSKKQTSITMTPTFLQKQMQYTLP